jgi:hypothetical protein
MQVISKWAFHKYVRGVPEDKLELLRQRYQEASGARRGRGQAGSQTVHA